MGGKEAGSVFKGWAEIFSQRKLVKIVWYEQNKEPTPKNFWSTQTPNGDLQVGEKTWRRRRQSDEEQKSQLKEDLARVKQQLLQATEACEKAEEDVKNYPIPEYLSKFVKKGEINIAVTGNSGVGKSSFINAILKLKKSDPNWAAIGASETTMEPKRYRGPGSHALLRRMKDAMGAVMSVSCVSRGKAKETK